MPLKNKLSKKQRAIIQRYLVWCYKTTKESLDRIDRKFTQALVDRFILNQLQKASFQSGPEMIKVINDFERYIATKEEEGRKQKFSNADKEILNVEYAYLVKRLNAIEVAIRHFLGPRMLAKISHLYETEMTRRILESKEH